MLSRALAPGYNSLAYLIHFRMIKLYLLPIICWQSMDEVAFQFKLLPVSFFFCFLGSYRVSFISWPNFTGYGLPLLTHFLYLFPIYKAVDTIYFFTINNGLLLGLSALLQFFHSAR